MKMYINEEQLNEMALTRNEAIDRCFSLGKQFIDHFHKCVHEGKDSDDFTHHCTEMQAWFDEVKQYKLKQNKRLLTADTLINWFFTVGSDVEEKIEEEYQDIYEQFYIRLLLDRNNSNVENILTELLI